MRMISSEYNNDKCSEHDALAIISILFKEIQRGYSNIVCWVNVCWGTNVKPAHTHTHQWRPVVSVFLLWNFWQPHTVLFLKINQRWYLQKWLAGEFLRTNTEARYNYSNAYHLAQASFIIIECIIISVEEIWRAGNEQWTACWSQTINVHECYLLCLQTLYWQSGLFSFVWLTFVRSLACWAFWTLFPALQVFLISLCLCYCGLVGIVIITTTKKGIKFNFAFKICLTLTLPRNHSSAVTLRCLRFMLLSMRRCYCVIKTVMTTIC